MRVIVQYDPASRLGNRMFQYAFGYILSKKYNCELLCDEPLPNFNISSNPVDYMSSCIIKTRDFGDQSFDSSILENFSGDVVVNSYLQRAEYYINYKEDLRELFGIKPLEMINNNSLVLHVRETDYKLLGWFLGYDYYKKIIDGGNYDSVMIVTDNPYGECVTQLVKNGCGLLSEPVASQFLTQGDRSAITDLKTLLYSENICLSQSTFSWWAAFLGYHKHIIFPFTTYSKWWKTNPGKDDVDLYFDIPGITHKFIL